MTDRVTRLLLESLLEATLTESFDMVLMLRSSWGGHGKSQEGQAIHAKGCSDVARDVARSDGQTMDIPGGLSPRDAQVWCAKEMNDSFGNERNMDGQLAWKSDDFRLMPCCYSGPKVAELDPKYCPGSGKPFASEVDYSYAYPQGICSVCRHSLGAKSGLAPKHLKTAEFILPNGRKARVKMDTTHVVYWETSDTGSYDWKEFSDQGAAERSFKVKARDSWNKNVKLVRVKADEE